MPDAPPHPVREGLRLPARKQLFLVTLAALLVLLLLVMPELLARLHRPPQQQAERLPPGTFRATPQQIAGLRIAPVTTMEFRGEVVTDGSIAYNDDTTTPVFSPYSGRVTRLLARQGDLVKRNAPLMAVEASEFVQGENDLLAAAAAVRTARAQLELAQKTEQRQHDLYGAQAGALKDWLQAQSDLTAGQGTLHSAEVALASARNRLRILGRSDEEIAAVEQGGAARAANPEALVRAPISGSVTQRQVGLGQYITSAAGGASNPVYTISDLRTVWLVANVRETDAPFLRLGQPVEVHALAFPDRIFKAKVSWIAPGVDPNTHRIALRAEVENPDGALRPMMFASFAIMTGEASTSPAVPQRAVVYEGSEAHVFVADGDLLAIRFIKTGRTRDDWVEVTSGLRPGERIVTAGTLFIDRAAQAQ
jgi:cobalt-zinc-cadmium efflux system membrane fusion protein